MKQDARKLEGEFDYIIVGAGTAGCVLANRLTEDADVSVLLLEAGGRDNYHWIHVPVGYLYCIGNPRTDWLYKTRGRSRTRWALAVVSARPRAGRVFVDQRHDLHARPARGLRRLGRALPAIATGPGTRCCRCSSAAKITMAARIEWHGAGGEWRVEKQRLKLEGAGNVRAGGSGERSSCHATISIVATTRVSGYFDVNQRSGIRWNASKAFLRPAMKRPNLTIITGAHTQRLMHGGQALRGCGISGGDTDYLAKSRCEVILSAGAVNSPQLLELSGIGNGARLQRLGIDVVQDLRGVGENLQDHLQLRMAYKVHGVRTLNTLSRIGGARPGLACSTC